MMIITETILILWFDFDQIGKQFTLLLYFFSARKFVFISFTFFLCELKVIKCFCAHAHKPHVHILHIWVVITFHETLYVCLWLIHLHGLNWLTTNKLTNEQQRQQQHKLYVNAKEHLIAAQSSNIGFVLLLHSLRSKKRRKKKANTKRAGYIWWLFWCELASKPAASQPSKQILFQHDKINQNRCTHRFHDEWHEFRSKISKLRFMFHSSFIHTLHKHFSIWLFPGVDNWTFSLSK